MTAKEKAIELIQKFRLEIYKGVITSADVNPKREAQRNDVARRSALVHVEQILKLELAQPIMMYGMNYVSIDSYYSQVKEEIEKL